jgi:hypothetical protein
MGIGAALIGAAGAIGGGYMSSRGAGGAGGGSSMARRLAWESQKNYEARVAAANEQATDLIQAGLWQTGQAEEGKYNVWRGLGAGYKPDPAKTYVPSDSRIVKTTRRGKTQIKYKPSWTKKREFGDITVSGIRPQEYAEDVLGSPQGQMVDYLTQQADQLIRGEGELWDKFTTSVFGAVTDQIAAASRQLGTQIKGMIAKGGDARNAALGMVQKIRGQEELNRIVAQNLRQGMMELNVWAIDNAKSQLAFNQLWVQGIPLSNSGYVGAMNNLMALYSTAVLPSITGAAGTALQAGMNAAGYEALSDWDKSNSNATWGHVITGLSQIAAGGLLDWSAGRNQTATPLTGDLGSMIDQAKARNPNFAGQAV